MTQNERPTLVYFSGTGQTKRLIDKINDGNFKVLRIRKGTETIEGEYILVTPTYMKGQVPRQVQKFININHPPKEVIGTGNKQWGEYFCGASKKISEMFNIPLIALIEQSGHFDEVDKVKEHFKIKYETIGV